MSCIQILAVFVCALFPNDRSEILGSLAQLEQRGVPGRICVAGEQAFPILVGGPSDNPGVVMAGARFGEGRVLAWAHESYLRPEDLSANNDNGQLLVRALNWCLQTNAEEQAKRSRARLIGVLGAGSRFGAWDAGLLAQQGFAAKRFESILEVRNCEALVWSGPKSASPEEVEHLREFVRQGGGLLVGACPWGYEQVEARNGRTLRKDLAFNQVLAPMGLAFARGTTSAPSKAGYSPNYSVGSEHLEHVNAWQSLARLGEGKDVDAKALRATELALRSMPKSAAPFWGRANAVLESVKGDWAPTPRKPLKAGTKGHSLARLRVTHESERWKELDPGDVDAASGAESFPGLLPKMKDSESTVLVSPEFGSSWQSTGLYLAPGAELRVSTSMLLGSSPSVERMEPLGLRLRVGCHSDRLWNKSHWSRWPEISRDWDVNNAEFSLASPFGGLIWVRMERADSQRLMSFGGQVSEAPFFSLRKGSTLDAWPERRLSTAPWAELEGRYITFSVPSSAVRSIEDPNTVKEILQYWDAVLVSHRELLGEQPQELGERVVCDEQISAGYMHAGTPIMTHLDVMDVEPGRTLPKLFDLDTLREQGNWGLFHELGHNCQEPEWTFKGTGEVTCNLFTLYSMQKLCGIEPWEHPWLQPSIAKSADYLKQPDFEVWKSDPGLALVTFAELQRDFGWQPFIGCLSGYKHLPAEQRPKTEQDKIDLWVARMSAATKQDLRGFFRRWGWPVKVGSR